MTAHTSEVHFGEEEETRQWRTITRECPCLIFLPVLLSKAGEPERSILRVAADPGTIFSAQEEHGQIEIEPIQPHSSSDNRGNRFTEPRHSSKPHIQSLNKITTLAGSHHARRDLTRGRLNQESLPRLDSAAISLPSTWISRQERVEDAGVLRLRGTLTDKRVQPRLVSPHFLVLRPDPDRLVPGLVKA